MLNLDNKGFTLIELLAALVVLTIIMSIAIPSISSSLERTKEKQDESRKKILTSAAELYVTDNKNAIYNKLESNNNNECYITINKLDLNDESKKDSNGEYFKGVIVFNRSNFSFEYTTSYSGIAECK